MKSFLYFLAGVIVTFVFVLFYGAGVVEEECKDAGGVLVGTTCINPSAIVETK
jgi:hypothetical protein